MVSLCGAFILILSFQAGFGNPWFGSTKTGRIVGGKIASDGQFPYVVSLRKDDKLFCGASILSSEWLITAAHCISSVDPKSVVAVVGTNKLNKGGDVYNVIKLVKHENFQSEQEGYDIGLVKVSGIIFNEIVQPVSLYAEYMPENVDASMIGWGRLGLGEPISNDLRYVNIKSISVESCKKQLNHIYESTLCTFSKYGEGGCQGDTGGPIVTSNANGVDLLAGIVSWGRPCAVGYPDANTRVYSYIPWIKENCNNCVNL